MVLKENTLYYFYFSLHWKILFLFNALGLQCIGFTVHWAYSRFDLFIRSRLCKVI